MRKLVVEYKAEKVCYEEMVKMPLVDLKVLEAVRKRTNVNARSRRSTRIDESKLYDIHVVCRDDRWSDLGVVIVRSSTIWERANVVVDAWSRKGGVKSRRVRDICRKIQAKVSKKMLVTDGQSERTFWTLENMFRACVRNLVVVGILTFHKVSFPTKIVIIRVFDVFSLDALYGRRGRSPVLYAEIGESKMIGLELEQETTKVFVLRKGLRKSKIVKRLKCSRISLVKVRWKCRLGKM
nr:hypothetical protein [Tanacetum cinerariifolium]